MVGNPEDRFSNNEAHLILQKLKEHEKKVCTLEYQVVLHFRTHKRRRFYKIQIVVNYTHNWMQSTITQSMPVCFVRCLVTSHKLKQCLYLFVHTFIECLLVLVVHVHLNALVHTDQYVS